MKLLAKVALIALVGVLAGNRIADFLDDARAKRRRALSPQQR